MSGSLWLSGLVGVCLFCLLVISSMADAALRALNQVRLRALIEQGFGRAEAMDRLLEYPHRITATTLIINTFALAGLSALTAILALQLSSNGAQWWLITLTIIVLALFVLIFGQLVPRSLAVRRPERTALRITRMLSVAYFLISPIARVAEWVTNTFLSIFGVKDMPRNPFITEDDLRMLVNAGEEEGVIEQEERDMIAGILRFGDIAAHEVMVPRPDIVAVDVDTDLRTALDIALEKGHSRLPVYEESLDNVLGIVYLKDLARAIVSSSNLSLRDLARPAVFIPESKKLGELLQEFQSSKVHMAIVVDEYGGTAGLVTIEDILEEIVGEIQDEYDVELPDIEKISEDEWIIRAKIDLDDVNELLGIRLPAEEYDTLGGFITAQLERLPVPGDEVEVEGVLMKVLDIEKRRVGRVLVKRLPVSTTSENQEEADES